MISYSDAWKTNWQFFTLLDRDWDYDPLTQEEIENTTLPDKFGWKTKNVSCLPLYTDRLTFFNGTFTLVDREHVWPIFKGLRNKRNDTIQINMNHIPAQICTISIWVIGKIIK